MAFIKHIGTHKGTNQRFSVVFLQLPDYKENAIVVYSDSLPDKYHDDFMSAVESQEGQKSAQLYEVLTRKLFWHGSTMLDTLHKEGLLEKMPTSSIIMTPNGQTQIALDDLISQMADIEPETATDSGPTVQERMSEQVDTSLADDNKMIAQNLLIQAVMLEEEAVKKRAEAVKFDPSLSEKAKKPAKKGRGRPTGTTAKAMAARSVEANADV
jgi:hypothetical protein